MRRIKRILRRTRKCRLCGAEAQRYACVSCHTVSWCSGRRGEAGRAPCENGCFGDGCGRGGVLERAELP